MTGGGVMKGVAVSILLGLLACGCSESPKTASGDDVLELIQQLKEGQESVRASAAKALGEKRPETRSVAVPALTLALRDEGEQVRESAARALGKMGEDARLAVPALKVTAQDSVPEVKAAAIEALEKIDPNGTKEES